MIQMPPVPESLKPVENELKELKISFEQTVTLMQNVRRKMIDINLSPKAINDLADYMIVLTKE